MPTRPLAALMLAAAAIACDAPVAPAPVADGLTAPPPALAAEVTAPERGIEEWIAALPEQTKTDWLVRLAGGGEPRLRAELLRGLRENGTASPRLVGYGSHVDAARLKAAREAGCDLVLPRSAFFERLPQEIGAWLGS